MSERLEISAESIEKKEEINNCSIKLGFNRRQWTHLALFGLANIFRAFSIIISGPFYPSEAESRGLSNTQIGFVFGSYDFSTFLTCILFGKFIIPALGPTLVLKLSTINLGICMILFGCLDLTENHNIFLSFSFIIRILAGAGDAGFYPSAFTIFAQEFPFQIATAIGLFEFMFGVGAIIGPIVFGAVIDSIGFLAVYAIVGSLLLLSALLIHLFTPESLNLDYIEPEEAKGQVEGGQGTLNPSSSSNKGLSPPLDSPPWWKLLCIPTLWLVILNLFSAAASIGFITATLENRLEIFNLSTFEVSGVFIVSNGIYTILTPIWGKIGDILGRLNSLNCIIISGSALIFGGFLSLSQIPFTQSQPKLGWTLLGLFLHGIGIGGAVMSAFPHALQTAIGHGFPEDERTYSLLSSVFTLTFTLGNSIGPGVGGGLLDTTDFELSTLFILSLSALVILFGTGLSICGGKRLNAKGFL